MGERRQLSKVLSEFFVIVVGVLVALACDAWWDARKQSLREQVIIRDLVTEFSSNREQLSADVTDSGKALDAARTIVRLGNRGLAILADDSARALAQRAITWRTFDPSNAVLKSVLETGELGVISSPALRSSLAAWDNGLIELQTLKDVAAQWTRNQILPRLFAGSQTTLSAENLREFVGLFVPHEQHLQSAMNESRRQLARADSVLVRLKHDLR